MDQETESQAPASQDQFIVLTELAQKLLRERESNQEPDDSRPNYCLKEAEPQIPSLSEIEESDEGDTVTVPGLWPFFSR
ncbi:hypothetical protein AYI69_g9353 [Smittium culicis]|uniref:Uncharacterized protein n=1 Tax=Smittium culicis TaxID=133412 RepID=A0A1R1XDC8_9FUNG|nr:hypothetical protein AYI69_g9353 [Smittium culicis]